MEEKDLKFAEEPNSPQESVEAKEWFEKNRGLLVARESHYSLPELIELASARRNWSEFWEMPRHLASCPVCIDCFEAILKNDGKADAAVLERMRKIHPLRRFNLELSKIRPVAIAKIAAAVVFIASASWFAMEYFSSTGVKISDGTLLMADGRQMSAGSVLPSESELTASRNTTAIFSDGSRMYVSKDSIISLFPVHFSKKIIQLSEGRISCEVSKQKSGRCFKVLTPAGEITAIGTKFSVDSHILRSASAGSGKELKFIHPLNVGVREDGKSRSEHDIVVTVKVEDGTVLVKNRYGCQNQVGIGKTAILRSGISVIDIFDDNSYEKQGL